MQILPDRKTKAALLKTMRAYRNACNHASKVAFKYKISSPIVLNRYLYHDIRKRYGLCSQMTQSVFRTVSARCKALETSKRWEKAAKFHRPLAEWVFHKDYRLGCGLLRLKVLGGARIAVPIVTKGMEQYLDGSCKMGMARIKLHGERWFLEMPVTKEIPILPAGDAASVVGVDLGLNFIVTTYDSDGKARFYDGRAVKHKRQRFNKRRLELSQKNTKSARLRLKALGNKERRWMRDVNHSVAKWLVESYPPGTVFVLEDLKGMSTKLQKKHGSSYYALAAWTYADLRQKIEYKAMKRGSRVIVVDPMYTSQTCPKCGLQSGDNRNYARHEFRCRDCGYTSNDDRVAAMNIYAKGVAVLQTLRAGQVS